MSRPERPRLYPVAAALALVLALARPATADDRERFFETKVRPVLTEHCVKCHGPEKAKSNLRLDTLAGAVAGGDSGPAVVPGEPGESLLVTAVGHEDDFLKMPPSKKLPREVVDDLTRWVASGAHWPGPGGGPAGATATPATRRPGLSITEKDRNHWAFRPVRRPEVPEVARPDWVRNPVDAFVLAGLEAKGLAPNPPAERHALIRRASFDLTGLPPTPAEVEAFVKDDAADAYDRLIDRLLDSPGYGEKWARHWLDLVRFAETNSYERDNPKPSAWRYRDYVIRSLNDDKPYDRFVREQLAGDELADGGNDGIIATGYYRLGIWDDEPTDRLQAQFDALDDVVATTSQVFLGLTVDCARCHDHKLDPIPQADYYRLLSFFRNVNHFRNGGPTDEAPLFDTPADRAAHEARLADLRSRRDDLKAKIEVQEQELLANARTAGALTEGSDVRALIRSRGKELFGEERLKAYQQLVKQLRELESNRPAAETALCVTEAGPDPPETFVLLRGNAHANGDKVGPAFLAVLGGEVPSIPTPGAGARSSGRRTALADWIASPSNPLTARVMANRVWQFHFGRGIVRSSSNFGLQGDAPTHPELLDWLASEFVAGGWRLKSLHRLIMTSNAYRMSSRAEPTALAADPENDTLWRFDMRRLTAEEIRDAILAVSGELNPAMFGPGVYPEIPAEVMAGQSQPGKGWGNSSPADRARRSVYVHVKRSLLLPIFESFDVAETDRSSPARFSTTQPTQALAMLNGKFLNDRAGVLADRLRREAGGETGAQVRLALRLTTGREPTAAEVARGVALVGELAGLEDVGPSGALKAFSLLALNLNEFLYID